MSAAWENDFPDYTPGSAGNFYTIRKNRHTGFTTYEIPRETNV